MGNTSELLDLRIWQPEAYVEDASQEERIALSYERARSVARQVGMTAQDIVTLSPRFWNYHRDCKSLQDTAYHTAHS